MRNRTIKEEISCPYVKYGTLTQRFYRVAVGGTLIGRLPKPVRSAEG
jgi:hypothetical protein